MHWVWLGGVASTRQEAYIRQQIVLNNLDVVTGTLSFWLRIPESSNQPQDTLTVTLDETALFQVDATEAAAYAQYTQVTVDVTPHLADMHTISFDAIIQALNPTSFYLDDIALVIDGRRRTGPDLLYLPFIFSGAQ